MLSVRNLRDGSCTGVAGGIFCDVSRKSENCCLLDAWRPHKTEVMKEKSAKTTRVQIEMPEKSMARLVSLKEKTDASSYAEVLRNALRLYEDMIEKHEQNFKIMIRDKDGSCIEYRIF